MKCEKCQNIGYIELDKIGLQCQICDCEAGKAYMERLGLTMPMIEESTTVDIIGATLNPYEDDFEALKEIPTNFAKKALNDSINRTESVDVTKALLDLEPIGFTNPEQVIANMSKGLEGEATYTGLYFQLAGKRTNEYSDDELWVQTKESALEKMTFPFAVNMPCGESKVFENAETISNLPIEDIPCPCGNPNHFIVRFVDLREEDDSINRAERDNSTPGSGDTSEPKQPKKPKAKKRARRKSK